MSIICVTQYTAHFLVYNQVQHRATTADMQFYRLEIDKLIFYLLGKKEYLNGDKEKSMYVLILPFLYFLQVFS